MKKVKTITKVLEGQKEVAIRINYDDGTVKRYIVPEDSTANSVLSQIIREGFIDLKGYDTSKRILVEQTAPVENSEEVVKNAKRFKMAKDEAEKMERELNKRYPGVANFKLNVDAFDDEDNDLKNESSIKPKKGRYVLVGVFGTLMVGGLIWGGYKLINGKNCSPVETVRSMLTSTSSTESASETKIVEDEEITVVENSKLTEKEVRELAAIACNSKYVAKCNYTQADIENVICNLHGLAMINTDCRITDPYRVEQFFNDMTSEAIANFLTTGEIKCFDYSKLYEEDSIECKALQNIEKGFSEVKDEEEAQHYFAKCYRVAQGLEVDGINVLQDTNEQFEGPFYYAVADRQMIYNKQLGKSLLIPAGYIWFDLGDEYSNISYDTQELYQKTDDYTGIMEGLRLDFIQNQLADCDDKPIVLVKEED